MVPTATGHPAVEPVLILTLPPCEETRVKGKLFEAENANRQRSSQLYREIPKQYTRDHHQAIGGNQAGFVRLLYKQADQIADLEGKVDQLLGMMGDLVVKKPRRRKR